MDGNKSCRWHALRIAVGMMVLGLSVVAGMGAVSVDEEIKPFEEVNQVFAAEMALSPVTKIVTQGQTFDLGVTIDPSGTPIAGAQVDIGFNSSLFRVNNISEGNFFNGNGTNTFFNAGTINNSTGTAINIFNIIIGNKNVSTRGIFIIINVTAIGITGTSGFGLSNVKISDPNGLAVSFNATNGSVSISDPTINVVSPNGGENWHAGTTKKIKWKYTGNPGSRVKIDLLKNGKFNRIIKKSVPIGRNGSGSYRWQINSTQTLGAGYKIRVKSTTNPAYTDKSNKNFSIDDFSADINKKLILVGVDGFSLAKYKSMYPQLKNFSNIVINGGWNGTLEITGHTKTTSAPGNAELMTGLKESQNGVSSNKGSKIVDGKTIWERLEVYNSSIVTGSVYGKKNSYITTPLFDNAIPDIDWWQDRNTYGARIWPCGRSVDYDVDVANKATEFIKQYNKNSFFLVVYFASPDGSGHYCGGDTGQSYTDSFINVDRGLGILLNSLKDNGIDTTTQIIITGDHGWNIGTTDHGKANNDTRILPLITNNITMLSNVTSNGREQGEVAPTILDFFGMTTSDYQDITNAGYQSMRAHLVR
jgi:Type I phosphodiesterase / nucleotide pyrophosphatase/Ser-Thr-rich glycosyl-phosphatidyl-inositol-anchored membrane family